MAKYTSTQEIGQTWVELNTTESNVAVQWLSGPRLRVAVADAAGDLAADDKGHLLSASVPCANLSELAGRIVCVRSADSSGTTNIAVSMY